MIDPRFPRPARAYRIGSTLKINLAKRNRYDASVAERADRAEGRLVPDAWAAIGESV